MPQGYNAYANETIQSSIHGCDHVGFDLKPEPVANEELSGRGVSRGQRLFLKYDSVFPTATDDAEVDLKQLLGLTEWTFRPPNT
jgi:hypothetical protein